MLTSYPTGVSFTSPKLRNPRFWAILAPGPAQPILTSPQHSRAHPVPSLDPSEETASTHTSSLVDVDSPHVSSVPSDFQSQHIQTDTQATRLEHEAEDSARRAEKKASNAAESAKKKAATKGKEIKNELKKGEKTLSDNRDNPVVIGNAVVWGVGIIALTAAGWQKHKEGKLDWQLAGSVAGALAVFGVADYFGSKYVSPLELFGRVGRWGSFANVLL